MDVKKILVSVYDPCATGHRVVFDLGPEGSYAVHKETGEKTEFERTGRTWDMVMKQVPFKEMKSAAEGKSNSLTPLHGLVAKRP